MEKVPCAHMVDGTRYSIPVVTDVRGVKERQYRSFNAARAHVLILAQFGVG